MIKNYTCAATRAAIITGIAPWTISQTVSVLPQMEAVTKRLSLWQILRQEPDLDALETIEMTTSQNLVTCTKCCDIFFPPVGNNQNQITAENDDVVEKPKTAMMAMIIVPGFCVNHTSYATIASKIANQLGIIVVVQNLEPFRVADKHFVEMKQMKKVMNTVRKEWRKRRKSKNNNGGTVISDWCFVGHSLGGYCVMRLAPQLGSYLQKSKTSKLKVMVWGCGDNKDYLTNLKSCENIQIQTILAKDDKFCNMYDALTSLKDQLPEEPNRIFDIVDGIHNNFASYGPSSPSRVANNIPRSKQHQQIIEKTIEFLRTSNFL